MSFPRVVADEVLDHLAPDDPAAMRSRCDLVRVHRAMGTPALLRHAWLGLLPARRAGPPLRILELGAGDGRLLLGVARTLAAHWPPVALSLLDRLDIVSPATRAGFAALGWSVQVQVADVLAWAGPAHVTANITAHDAPPAAPLPRWDLVSTTLFLHHFQRDALDRLLAAVAARADRFFACEPHRSWLALAGSHLVGAIGANAVTRSDAVASVRAGFRGTEISARWPPSTANWQLREHAAGLFSHCFAARRAGAGT